MYAPRSRSSLPYEVKAHLVNYRPSIHTRRANLTVKFQDIYGFTVEGNVDDVNVLNERDRVRQQGRVWWALEARKGANWYRKTHDSTTLKASLKFSDLASAIALKRLIRKGSPLVLRPKVWFGLSGSATKKSTVPESYYSDLPREPRYIPQRICLKLFLVTLGETQRRGMQLYDASFLHTLFVILMLAIGLNYVAALLLLVMKTEEDAFWMLALLLEDVLVNDCYANNLSGCHVEQRVFKDLLDKKCPRDYFLHRSSLSNCLPCLEYGNCRMAAHLEALEFDGSLVATEWFLCLFSKSLPSETTLRVCDVLFYEGAKVLLHVALAMFKMKEDELLMTHHVVDVINILQKATYHMFDPDELLTVAFDKIGFMMTRTISKQRTKRKPAVMAELDQRSRRLNSP
ncbi:LOW QUALITY PROTEIN: hypothetical protein Cgig2_008296 [Carnegiea gigantea]|uniref:Rab-GAP TBC domain-containing protein n=1 Tax=Carnegiea gigantea TaxID=171969 RepID=A0A9Q1GVI9_9CARY|nr:LOW QUALITY PROTEIN: hypothetical protein Cgig2_008296 [Carnegiea gigantea]